MPIKDCRTRFHFRIKDDIKSCNVKIWSKKFFNIDRDCIIPVHNILGRFTPVNYEIGKKNYMAVVLIERKFHM